MKDSSTNKQYGKARAVEEAVRFLLPRVLAGRRPADREIAAYFRSRHSLGSRDRRRIYDLVFAVFRWWGWARRLLPPAVIEPLTPRPGRAAPEQIEAVAERLAALPPTVWARVLLTAVFADDLPFPELAGVWWERLGRPASVLPEGKADSPGERGRRLFQALGCPELCPPDPLAALIPAWQLQYLPASPADLGNWISDLLTRPPTWVRARIGYESEVIGELRNLGIRTTPHPHLPGALRLDDCHVDLYRRPGFRNGLYEIQDLGSQAAGAACAPCPGQSWWDACAGAGGKTLLLADRLRDSGAILATDLRRTAIRRLLDRARRCGFRTIHTRVGDVRRLNLSPTRVFDGVLVDAPCSGSGTWGRNPDACWRLCPGDTQRLPELQREILEAAARHVRPGGRLLYVTCSVFPRENHDVAARFIETHPGFAPCPFPNPLQPAAPAQAALAIRPADGPCNGMFIACFQKKRTDS